MFFLESVHLVQIQWGVVVENSINRIRCRLSYNDVLVLEIGCALKILLVRLMLKSQNVRFFHVFS